MIIFVSDENRDRDITEEWRLAQIVSSKGNVKSTTVTASVGCHKLEVHCTTWPDFTADGVHGKVTASVSTDDAVPNLEKLTFCLLNYVNEVTKQHFSRL